MDDIHISYELGSHGWSTCWIRLGGKLHEIDITHVFSNPIDDCISALILLMKGEKEISFIWYSEPGGTRIQLTEIQDQQHKITVNGEEFGASYGEEIRDSDKVFEFVIEKRLFVKMLYHEFVKIANLLSEKSYAQHRRGDFPFTSLKTLVTYM